MSKGRDTLYEQVFRKQDGTQFKKFVWISDMEKGKYPVVDGQLSEPVFEEPKPESAMIITKKMSRADRIADRKKRSTSHFRKEILPTLGVAEKIHHTIKAKTNPSK